ncbi:MAG: hypothetical protein HEP71_18730 [Roseivirga sp.]|nr:hypothetical protein [Roseivirga sp.]
MKKSLIFTALSFVLLVIVYSLDGREKIVSERVHTETDQNVEVFDKVMSVVTHKRCMNCHPADDFPRQGEDSHVHRFGVQRGVDNHGLAALQCGSCHQEANNLLSGVPGAPHWSLAPKSMGWQGLNKFEIATAMLDRTKNGNRSKADIAHHLTEDPLVLWVFEPGVDNEGTEREKPPLIKEDWITAVKEWIAAGAPIPAEE